MIVRRGKPTDRCENKHMAETATSKLKLRANVADADKLDDRTGDR